MADKRFRSYVTYAGSSTTTHDVVNDLGREGIALALKNTGGASLTVQFTSMENQSAGDSLTLSAGESLRMAGLEIYTMIIAATDTYKAIVY